MQKINSGFSAQLRRVFFNRCKNDVFVNYERISGLLGLKKDLHVLGKGGRGREGVRKGRGRERRQNEKSLLIRNKNRNQMNLVGLKAMRHVTKGRIAHLKISKKRNDEKSGKEEQEEKMKKIE